MKRAWAFSCIPALLACNLAAGAPTPPPKAQATDIAAEAYIYGYPLVLMALTERGSLAQGTPINTFRHVRNLFGPGDKGVVRSNTDNLYSSAYVDLSAGPMVLHVPDTAGRYYLLQIMDAWSNTFASPGSRTTGSAAQDFIITGPDWRGPLRGNTTVFRSPTNMVWIIGRTEVRHYADPLQMQAELDTVHAIQDQYTLTPLGEWLQGSVLLNSPPEPRTVMAGRTPLEVLQSLTGVEFLQMLSALMGETPAPGWDTPALKRFEAIGFYPGQPFNPPESLQGQLNAAKPIAERAIAAEYRSLGLKVNGWGMVLDEIGTFGRDYLKRAAIARFGFGANLKADAIYAAVYEDSGGAPLNASLNNYRIHFPARQTPPVSGFWSITLYDGDYFFANSENRYAIHNTDPLQYNADGSLDIFLQTSPPDDPAMRPNWLPAPSGPFNLTLRMYWPDRSVLKGKWTPPPVEAM